MYQAPPIADHLQPICEQFFHFLRELESEFSTWQEGAPVDYGAFEEQVAQQMQKLECGVHGMGLSRLDMDAPNIRVWGDIYRRIDRTTGRYHSLAGDVAVERTLYRKLGERSGKTVDAVSLRAGAVADGWLPRTARAVAHLMAQGTSREAKAASDEVMRLPFSRSSFERVGHQVGRQYQQARGRIEAALIEVYEVPQEATSISVSIDRVAVPMEEPIEEKEAGPWLIEEHEEQMKALKPRFAMSERAAAAFEEAKPRATAKKRKVERNWRMAYVSTITLHDATAKALHTIRYGRMPAGNVENLCKRMQADVLVLMKKRPDLLVSLLADGAPEMWTLLDHYFCLRSLGIIPTRLVDYWHALEYLGSAAKALEAHTQAWPGQLRRWKKTLLEKPGAVTEVLAELRASGRAEAEKNEEETPVTNAIRYLANRVDQMDYATARQAGLPIGSGAVEATAKSLVGQRMKRSGARWKHQGGEDILQLRALMLSDRWADGVALALRPLRKSVRPLSRQEALAA